MEVESLVKLAGGGNLREVEDQWMARLEPDSASPDTVVEMLPVIDKLIERDQAAEAATLAWTTLELLGERFTEAELLPAAGQLLLRLNRSEELREQVTALYRQAHRDHPGIDRLIQEAGIAGGRPVRRALRTLEVCLAVHPDDYVAARHQDATARVLSLDEGNWTVRVAAADGAEKDLGPVEFADAYLPVDPDDYRVLRDFDRDRLAELLDRDPAGIVISILRATGNRMTSDDLEALLTPSLIGPKNWSRWWTKARTALKRSPHVELQGRSPYLLKYLRRARTLEQETQEQFVKLGDAAAQHAAVEAYLRECAVRKNTPDPGCLAALADKLDARARRQERAGGTLALGTRLVQRRVEQELGRTGAEAKVLALLQSTDDLLGAVGSLEAASLWQAACECLVKALPELVRELLPDLLLIAPTGACDDIAGHLVEAGFSAEELNPLVQQILSHPVRYNQALLWLWDGPGPGEVRGYRLAAVITRMLAVLRELPRDDELSPERKREVVASSRSALAARKYERFRACLEEIEAEMASALLTQIRRLNNLGRAVHEDLQQLVRSRFPQLDAAPAVEPWADQSVLLTASSGLARQQAGIDELINVKMPENARRIGEAASHGDLSDNAEYKFALEERDLLRARLAQMQEQLGLAKVIQAQDVETDRVGVGARVIFRHLDTGSPAEMVFLGPWDADIERHVYNYKAPVAQALMGKTVGQTVELTTADPQGSYEIVAIENGLA